MLDNAMNNPAKRLDVCCSILPGPWLLRTGIHGMPGCTYCRYNAQSGKFEVGQLAADALAFDVLVLTGTSAGVNRNLHP